MALLAEQRDFYREHGYLVIERLLGAETLAALRAAIAELTEASRGVGASDDVYDLGPDHAAAQPCIRRIKEPHRRHPAFDAVLRDPAIVDIAAELLGGTVRFDHTKLNFKPPGGGASIDWHQDWAYKPHTNDDLLAVGVMIEDCGPDDGPLMVIPGSHRGPILDHHQDGFFVGAVDYGEIAELLPKAVALTGPAGSITIHHVRTLHGSLDGGRSGSTRPLLLSVYAAVDAFPVFARPDLADFDARILRGRPTREARQTAVPVRIAEPRAPRAGSIFDTQAEVRGRSFGPAAKSATR